MPKKKKQDPDLYAEDVCDILSVQDLHPPRPRLCQVYTCERSCDVAIRVGGAGSHRVMVLCTPCAMALTAKMLIKLFPGAEIIGGPHGDKEVHTGGA